MLNQKSWYQTFLQHIRNKKLCSVLLQHSMFSFWAVHKEHVARCLVDSWWSHNITNYQWTLDMHQKAQCPSILFHQNRACRKQKISGTDRIQKTNDASISTQNLLSLLLRPQERCSKISNEISIGMTLTVSFFLFCFCLAELWPLECNNILDRTTQAWTKNCVYTFSPNTFSITTCQRQSWHCKKISWCGISWCVTWNFTSYVVEKSPMECSGETSPSSKWHEQGTHNACFCAN